MSIAVQVALVMVVLLVLFTGSRCADRCGNRTLFRSFNDLYAAIQCSFCNICTEDFCRL